jgi:hypothetical protein
MAYENKYVQVDGLKTRYIEDGTGPAASRCTALLWDPPPMFLKEISSHWPARDACHRL